MIGRVVMTLTPAARRAVLICGVVYFGLLGALGLRLRQLNALVYSQETHLDNMSANLTMMREDIEEMQVRLNAMSDGGQ